MSIKIQVDDAVFLMKNERYLGALTNLMLAVAASSRKTYPKKETKSFKFPNDTMRDNEAFKVFVSSSIRKMLFGDYSDAKSENTGISVNFREKQYDLSEILYKFYRCELVHEGGLPTDVLFSPPNNDHSGLSFSISRDNNSFVLDHNLLNILLEIVINARCNKNIFNVKNNDIFPVDEYSDEQISESLVNKYDITPGRFSILKEAVRHITPELIKDYKNAELLAEFSKLVSSGVINGSAITGLASYQLSNYQGGLEVKGINIIREIADLYRSNSV
jgi:hypothetical protein